MTDAHEIHDFVVSSQRAIEEEYARIRKRAAEDPGTAGDQGEENWAALLREWLPTYFHIVTKGRILTETGYASPQVDVLVLMPSYPRILLDKKLYLAGGVAAAFECKTTLKAEHVKAAVETCASLRKNLPKRTGSPHKELNSTILYGLLAHSHSWKSDKSTPLENVEASLWAADQQFVSHPIECVDVICVSDLAAWTVHKITYLSPKLALYTEAIAALYGKDGSANSAYVGHAIGQKFVYANGSALYLTNADGSEPRELVPAGSNPTVSAWRPTWSPDGNRLRFELNDGSNHVAALWEITAEGKDIHPLFPGWQDPPMQHCSSRTPDGRYYFFASSKNFVASASLPDFTPDIWAVREHGGWFRRPSGSPVQLTAGPLHFWCPISSLDGKVLFATSSSNRGELMHYDRKTQHLAPYLAGISAQGVSFSKDGAWMAYVTFPQGALWRSRTDGSEPLRLTFAPLIVHDPHWSPDGKQIAYSGLKPGGQWQLYLVSRDGSTSQRLLPGSVVGIDSTWSPDGNSILFGQPPASYSSVVKNLLQIFNLQTQSVSVVPGSDGLRSPRFSPDGKYISATSATDFRLMLFNVAAQKWTEQGPKHAGCQSWSRDSKYVYFITIPWLGRTEFHPQRLAASLAELGIFRVAVNNNKLERILSLKDFRLAGTFGAWLSLTPDDDPLVLRDVGPPEIYALSWEAP